MPGPLESLWNEYLFKSIIILFTSTVAAVVLEIRTHFIKKLINYLFEISPRVSKVRRLLLKDSEEKYNNVDKMVIEEDILPNYCDENGILTPAMWLIKFAKPWNKDDNEKKILLLGQGGSGKSVTMWYIYGELLFNREKMDYIPIYLDIKNDYTNGGIFNIICKHMKLEDNYKNWGYIKDKYFGNLKKSLNIILIADGYNEACEKVRDNFDDEIFIIDNYKIDNIKVILSSRYRPLKNSYKQYTSEELSEDNVTAYLKKKGIPESRFKHIRNILRLPILLTMYCKSMCSKIDEDTAARLHMKSICNTAGDIYWNYSRIHILPYIKTRANNIKSYDLQNYYIILFHILPYIGYRMGEKTQLKKSEIDSIIKEFCCDDACCLFNIEYISAHSSNAYTKGKWDCDDLRDDSYIMGVLCDNLALMSTCTGAGGKHEQYTFKHHLYRDFYSAVYSYNISMVMLYQNIYIDEKPILSNTIRTFYNQIVNMDEVLYYTKNPEYKYSYSKACNIISDLYYYKDRSDIPNDIEKALKYAEMSAKAGNPWGQWDTAFLYKEKAKKEKSKDLMEEYFRRSFDYARESAQNGYYMSYNILAQFYMEKWPPCSNMSDKDSMDEAVRCLKRAEERGYNFAYNNHGSLIEKGRIELDKSDNRINAAFKLFKKSAELGDSWAKSRVAFYLRHYWMCLDEYRYKDDGEEDAKEKSFLVCKEEYERIKNTKEMMNSDNIHGYGDILMNLGEHYLDTANTAADSQERLESLKKALPVFIEAFLWKKDNKLDCTNAGMRALFTAHQLKQDIPGIDIE